MLERITLGKWSLEIPRSIRILTIRSLGKQVAVKWVRLNLLNLPVGGSFVSSIALASNIRIIFITLYFEVLTSFEIIK
jgi:hypothetical protein